MNRCTAGIDECGACDIVTNRRRADHRKVKDLICGTSDSDLKTSHGDCVGYKSAMACGDLCNCTFDSGVSREKHGHRHFPPTPWSRQRLRQLTQPGLSTLWILVIFTSAVLFPVFRCETNIDECVSNPCVFNGTCLDGINNFTCNCTENYVGDVCEIDVSIILFYFQMYSVLKGSVLKIKNITFLIYQQLLNGYIITLL